MAATDPARKPAGAVSAANDDAARATVSASQRHDTVAAEPIDISETRAEAIDRLIHAWQARFTASISPAALRLAFSDWAMQFLNSPGKQQQLTEKAARKWLRLMLYQAQRLRDPDCAPCIEPLTQDRRFIDPAWRQPPFDTIYQSFLLGQQWLHNAMTGVRGVSKSNERIVDFTMRQLLDMVSPAIGDIHKVSNGLKSKPSVSLHLYGGNIGAINRHSFDASGATNTFRSGYSSDIVPNVWVS